MKNKKTTAKERNWVLALVSSVLILLGSALVVLAIMNIALFGWWSLLLGVSGLMTIGAAIMSIIKNDPSWILLDLLLPG